MSDDYIAHNRIPAKKAIKRSLADGSAKWPSKHTASRLTPVCIPETISSFKMVPGQSVFTIGSCFARHIETELKSLGFIVPARQFAVPPGELLTGTKMSSGVLNKYTPHSMLNEVSFAAGTSNGEEFLIEIDGQYLDGQLHTDRPVSLERAIERRHEIRALYLEGLRVSPTVIITLGLIESWWDSERERYLNETPKPELFRKFPRRFFFEILSVDETLRVVDSLVLHIHEMGPPAQRILITVSPIPLARTFSGRDVIVANSYSKSLLRVAADVVASRYEWVDYYPSYESITHSERAAAWEDDLIHVRSALVDANIKNMVRVYSD